TDKYVFFGTSASGMQDLKTIPSRMEKMPGVQVHAVAFLNMMNQAFVKEVSEFGALPYFGVLAFLLVFGFLYIRPLLGFVVSLVLVFSEMFLFILWFLPKYGMVFPIVTLMLLTFFTYLMSSLYTYFIREKKNRRLKNAFGTYVSPDIVDKIIRDPAMLHLGG